MSAQGSITALLERLKSGDHDAARPLWERYYPRLVALARTKLRQGPRRVADEEDVALSAFGSFCRGAEQGRFPDLHDRDSLWSILAIVTARKAIDLVKHNLRQKRGGGDVRGDSVLASAEGGFDDLEGDDLAPEVAAILAEEVDTLLQRLQKEELRQVAVWKLEGFSNAEIALKQGCSEKTIERRLNIIRNLLKQP